MKTPARKMATRQIHGGHLADAWTLPTRYNVVITGPPLPSEWAFHVILSFPLRSDGGPALPFLTHLKGRRSIRDSGRSAQGEAY